MKNIMTTMLLGLGLVGFTSCSDDNDSNPTLQQATTFTLNTPAMSQVAIDLERTTNDLYFTWSQPDYGGMPLVTTYYLQYAADAEFSTTTDEEGNVTENYYQSDEPVAVCNSAISVADLNRNLMHLLNVTSEDQVPAVQDVYFRVSAKTYSTDLIYSNVVKMQVVPYYLPLTAADPIVWYLTGNGIGDGSWNSDNAFGCIPMFFTPDNSYNEVDGTGVITWTGYLVTSGFKFRGSTTDNWATQIGQGDSFGEYKLNDGGSANISVPSDGLYTVTLDTKTCLPAITPYDGDPHVCNGVSLSGDFNGWGDEEMTPVNTTVVENHDWYMQIDLIAGNEVKFKETGSWNFNWGGSSKDLSYGFYGQGVQNGPNIYIAEEGTYDIYFNDITGLYRFVKQ